MKTWVTPIVRLIAGGLAALACLAPQLAFAVYPDKPLTLIVPFPPGGATDTVGRIIGKGLSEQLGQPVLVENRAGAGTVIGAEFVAKSPADGYRLLISSNTTFTVNPAIKRSLPYDAQKSFESIGLVGYSPLLLLAHPSVPVKTVQDVVALAKKQPGKLAYGSFGVGTTAHLAGEMFKVMAMIDLVHVPYKGSSPAMTDLIGGQIPLTFDTNVAAMPQMAAGKVRAIAITSKKRDPSMPNVPTIAESGYPDYEMVPWFGIVSARGLPADVRDRLAKALRQTVTGGAYKADLQKAGVTVEWQPGTAYDERVARELPLLRAYVHKANIPAE